MSTFKQTKRRRKKEAQRKAEAQARQLRENEIIRGRATAEAKELQRARELQEVRDDQALIAAITEAPPPAPARLRMMPRTRFSALSLFALAAALPPLPREPR